MCQNVVHHFLYSPIYNGNVGPTVGTMEQRKLLSWSDESCFFYIIWMTRCVSLTWGRNDSRRLYGKKAWWHCVALGPDIDVDVTLTFFISSFCSNSNMQLLQYCLIFTLLALSMFTTKEYIWRINEVFLNNSDILQINVPLEEVLSWPTDSSDLDLRTCGTCWTNIWDPKPVSHNQYLTSLMLLWLNDEARLNKVARKCHTRLFPNENTSRALEKNKHEGQLLIHLRCITIL